MSRNPVDMLNLFDDLPTSRSLRREWVGFRGPSVHLRALPGFRGPALFAVSAGRGLEDSAYYSYYSVNPSSVRGVGVPWIEVPAVLAVLAILGGP